MKINMRQPIAMPNIPLQAKTYVQIGLNMIQHSRPRMGIRMGGGLSA